MSKKRDNCENMEKSSGITRNTKEVRKWKHGVKMALYEPQRPTALKKTKGEISNIKIPKNRLSGHANKNRKNSS